MYLNLVLLCPVYELYLSFVQRPVILQLRLAGSQANLLQHIVISEIIITLVLVVPISSME
jgi:hypothetical protein